MTMDQMPSEMSFSPDFASRVLDEAGRVAARRTRMKRMGVLSAALVVTGAFGLWSAIGSRTPMPAAPVTIATSTDSEPLTVAQSARTEPLNYMFPGAASLVELSDQYANATTAAVTARRNMLFGETAQDVE
jgi:hypothetical protein